MTGEDGGASGDTGIQWDRVFPLKSSLETTMTLASVWKGEQRGGSCPVKCCGSMV